MRRVRNCDKRIIELVLARESDKQEARKRLTKQRSEIPDDGTDDDIEHSNLLARAGLCRV